MEFILYFFFFNRTLTEGIFSLNYDRIVSLITLGEKKNWKAIFPPQILALNTKILALDSTCLT